MAIVTMDGLVSAMAAAQYVDTEEAQMTSKGAGLFQSLWRSGGRPSAGAVPGSNSGIVLTSATPGAIPFTNPGGSNTLYLARFEASSTSIQSLIIYDRLITSDGLNGTLTTSQTVGTPALTRSTSGANVGLWIEIYTSTGASAANATISYTNQAGTAGQSTVVSIPASPVAGQMFPVPLASGDTGVRAVASVTLAASTGTAGSFGVTLAARIATVPLGSASVGQIYDYAALGLPVIQANACIAYKVLCTSNATGQIITGLTLAQG
jgi:hypothetical protein